MGDFEAPNTKTDSFNEKLGRKSFRNLERN